MYAALAYLSIGRVESEWHLIMENLPDNEKSFLFMDYFVPSIPAINGNLKVPIDLWNLHGHQNRTNNVVESWQSKLNSIIERYQPNVFLLVTMMKEEAQKDFSN